MSWTWDKTVPFSNSLDRVIRIVLAHHIDYPTQVAVAVEGVAGEVQLIQIIPVEQLLTQGRHSRVMEHEMLQLRVPRVLLLEVEATQMHKKSKSIRKLGTILIERTVIDLMVYGGAECA